jgi:hypothetical protein
MDLPVEKERLGLPNVGFPAEPGKLGGELLRLIKDLDDVEGSAII